MQHLRISLVILIFSILINKYSGLESCNCLSRRARQPSQFSYDDQASLNEIRNELLSGEISVEEFVRFVRAGMDRTGLTVNPDIASHENYDFGSLSFKENPDLLVSRRLTADIGLLKRATDNEQIIELGIEAIETVLREIALEVASGKDWTSYQAMEINLMIIYILAGDADLQAKEKAWEAGFAILPSAMTIAADHGNSLEVVMRIVTIANALDLADPETQKKFMENPDLLSEFISTEEIESENFWQHNTTEGLEEWLNEETRNIVYVFDNAGEDILDFMLIKLLLQKGHSLTLVAKAIPARNDTTVHDLAQLMEDGRIKALINGYEDNLTIIDSGTICQGTDLERISGNFYDAWRSADLIIFKGQGNYYTTHGYNLNPDHRYLYLLRVKWEREVDNAYEKGANIAICR